MSSITGRPSRFDRKRTRDNLQRRRKQRWDARPSQSSPSSTLSSSRLMPSKQVKKPAASPQELSEFRSLLCSCLIHDESPPSIPKNMSSSSFPIVIPATTGELNGIDNNFVVNTPPPLPPCFCNNLINRNLSIIPMVIPDTTANKNGIDDNIVVVNTPPLPFLFKNPQNRHDWIQDAPELVAVALSKSQRNSKNKNETFISGTATLGCNNRMTPLLRTTLLEKAKIDVNKTIYYPANNNYGPDNIGIFPAINFTSDESFLGKDNLTLTDTETGNNVLNHNDCCKPDNIDVRFSQYFDDNLLASRKFMQNFMDQNFRKNNLKSHRRSSSTMTILMTQNGK